MKKNWKDASPLVREAIERKLNDTIVTDAQGAQVWQSAARGLLSMVRYAFELDHDFTPEQVRECCLVLPRVEALEAAGKKAEAEALRKRAAWELSFELQAVQFAESRREWAKGEPLADKHAREVAEQRARQREAELDRAAAQAVADAEQADRVKRVAAARAQITKEQRP